MFQVNHYLEIGSSENAVSITTCKITDYWHESCLFTKGEPNLGYPFVMRGRKEMKKVPLFILLPLFLLACATVNHSAVPSDQKLVTVTWTLANIRSGIGNDYPVVKFVKQGDKLTLIGESGDWFNVRFENGQQGWISNRVVK